ncbi:MAG TPA: FtsW/RodA/SpoVE family cell cycle protein [Anaerolineales bacterium]
MSTNTWRDQGIRDKGCPLIPYLLSLPPSTLLSLQNPPSTNRTERGLIVLAVVFVLLFSASLTLAPAARARSWQVDYPWEHWLGVLIWAGCIIAAHLEINRRLPERDPLLLPLAALLSGWGLMTIWRLVPAVGLRQSLWLLVSGAVFTLGLRLPRDLGFMRRYKYVWLTGGLLLTALTLILGTNPLGYGPRLWLGCCGLYFQPSEPLKLLLITYLAAYLAEMDPFNLPEKQRFMLPWLAPTLLMAGLALSLLLVQRDLGTSSIFIYLYVAVVFIATGNRRIVLYGGLTLLVAGITGYALFDVVRLRVDAWINPWLDPSGRSYQIVQSLLAVSNGGLFGRGPGLGYPTLVPISHSDFIFAAIAEENGLMGALVLLLLLALFALRGLRIALRAPDTFRRYLAAGLTAHLVGQSILIIGGNMRLLPLTGVTLPFISYGGSSLLTSFISLLFLELIGSGEEDHEPAPLPQARPYRWMGAFLLVGLGTLALAGGWLAFIRSPALLARNDNARRFIADRYVQRGALLDRRNTPLVATYGEPGTYSRSVVYPLLSSVIGYSNPIYGQSGLEASLNDYLRGLRGNPGLTTWWNYLLYGQHPPGLDVRLSLDLHIQRAADENLGEHIGAIVLLNSLSGEILAMATHPTFDANVLDDTWENLVDDQRAPLLNRATQGSYPVGVLENVLIPQAVELAGLDIGSAIYLPAAASPLPGESLALSPLQVALTAAAVNNGGKLPIPNLVMAVNTPAAGWVVLQSHEKSTSIFSSEESITKAQALAVESQPVWQITTSAADDAGQFVSWFVGGTLPEWSGAPLAIAVVLEENNPQLAEEIGRNVLQQAMMP